MTNKLLMQCRIQRVSLCITRCQAHLRQAPITQPSTTCCRYGYEIWCDFCYYYFNPKIKYHEKVSIDVCVFYHIFFL